MCRYLGRTFLTVERLFTFPGIHPHSLCDGSLELKWRMQNLASI